MVLKLAFLFISWVNHMLCVCVQVRDGMRFIEIALNEPEKHVVALADVDDAPDQRVAEGEYQERAEVDRQEIPAALHRAADHQWNQHLDGRT